MIRPTFQYGRYRIIVGPYDPQRTGRADGETVYSVERDGRAVHGGRFPKTVAAIGAAMVAVYDRLRDGAA